MRVAFLTLGCKVNYYETGKIKEEFEKDGYEIVDFDETADIYIVNTCTVTNMADRKSRQMLHRAKKHNPNALVVACGCYADAKDGEALGADMSVVNKDKKNVLKIVNEALKGRQITEENADGFEKKPNRPAERTRAFIKIQDGCNQFCTYCLIPYVRGRGVLVSKPEDEVVDEVIQLVRSGYKEVVLTGIHLSSYGTDIAGEKSFLKLEGRPLISLIGKLNDIEGLERIRLSSLEPRIITENWAKQLATFEKVCPHFHLSMQSGCDETLKRMNRHYTSAEYAEKVDILRKIYENPAITTDVIVGFPGETEEEFETTFEFVKKIGFADLHIFQYSKRDGTIAAKMDDQVSAELKKQRSEQLAKVMEQSKKEYEKLFEGIDQEILFETEQLINGKTYLTGFNTRYVRFFLDTEKAGEYGALSGEICCIRAADLRTD